MNTKHRIYFTIITIFIFVIIFSFRVFSIPIPVPFCGYVNYHPMFENYTWKQITIICYIHTAADQQKIKCIVRIDDDQLKEAHKVFSTENSKGWPVGVEYQNILVLESVKYSFRFESPNTLQFSKIGDSDLASIVNLKSDKFYNVIKICCLKELRKKYPAIQDDNIQLCEYYTHKEHITPYCPCPETLSSGSNCNKSVED